MYFVGKLSSLTQREAFTTSKFRKKRRYPLSNFHLSHNICFWKIPRFVPFVFLVKATHRWRWVWSIWWNDIERGKGSTLNKVVLNPLIRTAGLIWTDWGLNGSPIGRRLSHGTTVERRLTTRLLGRPVRSFQIFGNIKVQFQPQREHSPSTLQRRTG